MTSSFSRSPGRVSSAALVALILAVGGVAIARETGQIDGVMARRGMGAALGLIMIVTGNILPKLIFPRTGDARAGAAERLCGWILVATGLALVAGFSLIADDHVALGGSVIGLVGFASVALTLLTSRWSLGERRGESAATNIGEAGVAARRGQVRVSAVLILHAIVWVFAMFIADEIWGDRAGVWMVTGFTLANIGLALSFRDRVRPAR